jgi:hypothetical protein
MIQFEQGEEHETHDDKLSVEFCIETVVFGHIELQVLLLLIKLKEGMQEIQMTELVQARQGETHGSHIKVVRFAYEYCGQFYDVTHV